MTPAARPSCPFLLAIGAIALAVADPLQAQQTVFSGFADITTRATTERGVPTAFGLGQYDLFVTSRLSDRVSFLGETVFEYDDGFIVDVERVVITYRVNEHLRVSGGKHHTPIGFWNNAYHHGMLLQPTIERPRLFKFEDEGGVLPIHATGVQVSGRDLGAAHLAFDVLVGNGIGATSSADNDNAKSVTVAVTSQLTSGLRVGASLYADRIASGTPALGGTPLGEPVDMRIAGGHLTYEQADVEIIAEWQRALNVGGTSRLVNRSTGYFIYGGYRFGRFVPYARLEALRVPVTDPYFVATESREALVGARYDLAATAVAKLELARRTTGAMPAVTLLTMQFAIGF